MRSIAVVGGGVAGLTAAYLLSKKYEVTLFEKEGRLGGHTNTIEVNDSSDRTVPVDTGFIVCNTKNYPNFYKLLNEWGVELQDSEMSFGYYNAETNFGYTGPSVSEFIQQWRNIFRKDFREMVLQQWRFNRQALKDLKSGELTDIPLRDYLDKLGVSDFFIDNYLLPVSAAIWSSPDEGMLNFPTATFVQFFNNHGMLEFSKRPQWQTVVGGSFSYIKKFREKFTGKIHEGSPVKLIKRTDGEVKLTLSDNSTKSFDSVVIATHADQAFRLLDDPTENEKDTIGKWRYNKNHTVLHSDTSLLPPDRKLWASWNYKRVPALSRDEPIAITYYMNKLQRLKTDDHYLVSLNQKGEIDEERIIYSVDYEHPVYDEHSVRLQGEIADFNGENSTFYCGSYLGYGFHEDAVASSVRVANKLGISL